METICMCELCGEYYSENEPECPNCSIAALRAENDRLRKVLLSSKHLFTRIYYNTLDSHWIGDSSRLEIREYAAQGDDAIFTELMELK